MLASILRLSRFLPQAAAMRLDFHGLVKGIRNAPAPKHTDQPPSHYGWNVSALEIAGRMASSAEPAGLAAARVLRIPIYRFARGPLTVGYCDSLKIGSTWTV